MTQLPMAQLEELYAKAPKVHCKGLCSAICTGISMSPAEWRRMERRGGRLGPPPQQKQDGVLVTTEERCRYLSAEGRCTVYDVRPMVCRLWGGVESMPCPHGCEVEGALATPDDLALLSDAMFIGEAQGTLPGDQIRRAWDERPDFKQVAHTLAASGQAHDRRLILGEDSHDE